MLRIKPFAALRPRPELVERVACVPYDVVNTEEARALAQDELSFLHVTRAEIDLPPGADIYSPEGYALAAKNFQKLKSQGVFVRDPEPSLYIYRQETTLLGRQVCQTGVMGCFHIDDYLGEVIKKHEKTRKDKEDDRTRHTLALKANPGPVFLLHKGKAEVTRLVDQAVATTPLYRFVAPDGVRHTVWRAERTQELVEAFAGLGNAYIADGHHRSASAARAGAELRAANPNHRGDEEYNWFLAVIFSKEQLTILPYHRVVKDLTGMAPAELLKKIKNIASVQESSSPEPRQPGTFGMYLGGRWYLVSLPELSIDRTDPIGSLDYILLSERILQPLLGIGDLKTDKRIDFVGGIRGTSELEKRVNSGQWAVAFAMYAATIDQLIRVADAGQIMPPKSTWFEPKLRSGLLVHLLE
jgi:uncharacterized protein (DUF1015 family)